MIGKRMHARCEDCIYFDYDAEIDSEICSVSFDQDEMSKMMSHPAYECPYFRFDEEKKGNRR